MTPICLRMSAAYSWAILRAPAGGGAEVGVVGKNGGRAKIRQADVQEGAAQYEVGAVHIHVSDAV